MPTSSSGRQTSQSMSWVTSTLAPSAHFRDEVASGTREGCTPTFYVYTALKLGRTILVIAWQIVDLTPALSSAPHFEVTHRV